MMSCLQVGFLFALVFIQLHLSEGKCPSSNQIECKTGRGCVNREKICDHRHDCSDGSDEDYKICRLWPTKDDNCYYDDRNIIYDYNRGRCFTLYEMCLEDSPDIDPKICKIVLQPTLGIQDSMNMSNAIIELLSSAVNSTLDYKKPDCPMLYTRLGSDCLSFFSPAKVSWAEARQFCISIYGDLWHMKNFASYGRLMEHMKEQKLTSSYWIGGRFDIDTNSWSWVMDDSAMSVGAPFWALKHNDSCVSRGSSSNTAYYSTQSTAGFSDHCYRHVMAPTENSVGWCSAMTHEYFYFWSDEWCDETFSPLCVFTGPASSKENDTD